MSWYALGHQLIFFLYYFIFEKRKSSIFKNSKLTNYAANLVSVLNFKKKNKQNNPEVGERSLRLCAVVQEH